MKNQNINKHNNQPNKFIDKIYIYIVFFLIEKYKESS